MKIEVLFPEYCNLFADSSNVKYLKQCLPEAEFIYTRYTDEPAFATTKVDLIYMGGMTEKTQLKVIDKLMPYKEKIEELINDNVPFLVTSNAIEIFYDYIEAEDGTKNNALGIFHFYAKQDMLHRFNCLVRGTFEDITIVGFKTQFTFAYTDKYENTFIKVDRGVGMNRKCDLEGIRKNNFFATYLVGPFLVTNPDFTKYLLKLMGEKNPKLAFEDVIYDAYNRRLKEFNDPNVKFED